MIELVLEALRRLDIVLASGSVLIAFSLLAYLFVHNFGHPVARSFVIVLAVVTVVYVGDVFLVTARLPKEHVAAAFWLKFQWLGIAFIAPAYLLFSHALLAATGDTSRVRRWLITASFAIGATTLAAVVATDWLVAGVAGAPGAIHLVARPLFPPFAFFYGGLTVWGLRNVWRARTRALTPRSRRRLSYLLVSAIAPISVFPYLMVTGTAVTPSPIVFRVIVALGNVAIATMLVLVVYSVAFLGALTPERHVKRDLVKYLVHVPTLGVWVIFLTQLVPERLEGRLGLPRDVVLALTLVAGIVVYEFLIRAFKPVVDSLIYGSQSRDAMWLRRLDERLLTDQDLEQLLENIVTALADRLRVDTCFVVVMRGHQLHVDALAGSRARAVAFIAALSHDDLAALAAADGPTIVTDFRVYALKQPNGGATLGLLAFEERTQPLDDDEEAATGAYVGAAQRALEDRVVQGRVLGALRDLEPELEGLQRLRGQLEREPTASLGAIEASPTYAPDFPNWVRDALADYWGGPRLTESPLLGLRIVKRALVAEGHNPAKAMRHVLNEALERLKPEGERSMTAVDWLAYNILELKFVRGLKVRDIATRLAMSESDLYRKQRVAIEALARQLAAMEARPDALAEKDREPGGL